MMWVWLRLWVSGLTENLFTYEDEAAPNAAYAPSINRSHRIAEQYFARRKAKGYAVPAAREIWVYRHFGDPFAKPLRPTQYLERLCRLSGHARVLLYRLRRHPHRCVREELLSQFDLGIVKRPDGLWGAHLWPG